MNIGRCDLIEMRRTIVLFSLALALALLPLAAADDPFGPIRVQYQDRLEPGGENARLDIGLSLPTGYQVYEVEIQLLPEDPISSQLNASFVGRMGPGTMAIATFYVNINQSAAPGIYQLPVRISYRVGEFGPGESTTRTVLVVVEEKIADPFGSILVETNPSILVPGLKGIQVDVGLPYAGMEATLYDVSISLGLVHPFASDDDPNQLGLMSPDTIGLATFYLDIAEDTVSGSYDLILFVNYRLSPDGEIRLTTKKLNLFVTSEEIDPFGSLGVVTDPSVLVQGLSGVEVRVSIPYLGGLVERLYDVSVSLNLKGKFTTVNDTYFIGVMSPQASFTPAPTATFYLDVNERTSPGIHQIEATISFRTSVGGPELSVVRIIQLPIADRGAGTYDPFGSMLVGTDVNLISGVAGVELTLQAPYIGLDERIYDVSFYLDLAEPISSPSDSYYLGMMSPQSPVAQIPPAVFYLDVAEGAVPGEYDVPVLIRYRMSAEGSLLSTSKVAKLYVVSEEDDPFGSIGVTTDSAVILPGFTGIEVQITTPYHGGVVDYLHDVSVSLNLVGTPFKARTTTYQIGIIAPQSPVGPPPMAVFYLDVAEDASSIEYGIPVTIKYRLFPEGEFRTSSKVAKLYVEEESDPFGQLVVSSDPSDLIPGLRSAEISVSVPFLGGLVELLHDVSVTLDLTATPFTTSDDASYLGVVSPASPIGLNPVGMFYIDVGEGDICMEYDVPVSIEYRLNPEGAPRTVDRTIKLAVVDPDPVWLVASLSPTLSPGSSEIVSILVENRGGAATDVTASFVPQDLAWVKPEDGTVFAGDFGVNGSRKISFPVLVDEGVSGNQLVTIEIEYTAGGLRILESHSITLRVGGLMGPSLVIADVTFSPKPQIGIEFEARMKIENVGTEAAESCMIDLNLPNGLGVVGSGSTLSIGDIGAGESIVVDARMIADSASSEGTKDVAYVLRWRNADGVETGKGGSFGLTLTGIPDVVIQRIDIDPPKLESRTKGTFQVTVRNPGTQLVSDIVIRLQGAPELFTETVMPVGSLFPKQSDAVVFGIFVDPDMESDTYPINVSITYLDQSGQEHYESAMVDLKIYQEKPFFNLVNVVIIVAIIAAFVIILLVFGGPSENGNGNNREG